MSGQILLIRQAAAPLILEAAMQGPPGPAGAAGIAGVAGVSGISVSQVAHGLSVQDWIAFDGSAWIPAQATVGGLRCEGVVTEVPAADSFAFAPMGAADFESGHGYALGPLYLSQSTPGRATSTPPGGGMRQRVGIAISTTQLIVQPLPQEER